ncbi:hypothetical protein AB0I30_07270 [Nocardia tengchongensis]|uniref:hypothetical protein n=1 Tax=Nocardia tengchongensis TaxID=2055889 RepID=UPI0033E1CD72
MKVWWGQLRGRIHQLQERIHQHRWLLIVASVALTIISLLALIHPRDLRWGELAAWVGAVGTFAAVSIALLQSQQARMLADRDRIDAYRQLTETQLENRRIRREDREERERERLMDTLVQLLEAWDVYRHDPEDRRARARVRALVSSLPGHMARVAGIEVEVPRTPYGKTEFQPIHIMYYPPHRAILKDHLARLEIEHNLKRVRGDEQYALATELNRFIEFADNPYNEHILTPEQEADVQARYEAELRGEPTDGASVTYGSELLGPDAHEQAAEAEGVGSEGNDADRGE